MDSTHTTKENCKKVEALIAAVQRLNNQKAFYPTHILIHEIESLDALAAEAQESLDAIRYKAL